MARILVCDDAADLRMLIGISLEMDGHDIVEADGGTQALRILADDRAFDLLMLDVQMPETDGWDVLRWVRQHDALADLRIIMCTVKFSQADLMQGWSLGCDGYMTKPFDLDQLNTTAADVIRRPEASRSSYRARQIDLLTAATGQRTF